MFKKIFLIILLIFTFVSCTKDTKNLQVTGTIKGVQKATLYLEKIKDTMLVKVDSVTLYGTENFSLQDNIESPEMYFLSISKSDKILPFFAEKGNISIKTDLKTFSYKPEIKGSKNQEILDTYNDYIQKFNNKRLDLLKEKFDAIKNKQPEKVIEIEKKIKSIDKRQYYYTLNFCFKNANYSVAPYLTLSELYNLNTSYLDTIINAMPESVKKEKYGIKLINYVAKIKKEKKK